MSYWLTQGPRRRAGMPHSLLLPSRAYMVFSVRLKLHSGGITQWLLVVTDSVLVQELTLSRVILFSGHFPRQTLVDGGV